MEYFVADTYKYWERIGKPFDKNGKLYTKVKEVCNRCNGTGIAISHIENGRPIPYANDSGMCYCCEGAGSRNKEVRLYTEAEYTKMTAVNEANRIKKAEAQEKKMKEEYEVKKTEWLAKEGFNDNLTTFVVTGNSYSIKEELKAAGFRFNNILKWHRATPSEDYPCIEIAAADVLDFSAWGTGTYHSDAQKFVESKIAELVPASKSEWVGVEKDKLFDLPVVITNIHGYTNAYGYGRIFTFETAEGNILKWFTASNASIDEGDEVLMTATVKEHSEYKGVRQTIVSRPKFKVRES